MVTVRLLAIGFIVAALAKSAQLPFTPWIARALEGPTPSSALFYGAVMVHAGVYLLLRLSPLLAQVPDVMAGLVLAAAEGIMSVGVAWPLTRATTMSRRACSKQRLTSPGASVTI